MMLSEQARGMLAIVVVVCIAFYLWNRPCNLAIQQEPAPQQPDQPKDTEPLKAETEREIMLRQQQASLRRKVFRNHLMIRNVNQMDEPLG